MKYNKEKFRVVATDGEIDLIEPINFDSEQDFFYDIALHNTDTIIGDINYEDKYRDVDIMGNIGYCIRKEYRGNHYARKALELLKKILSDRGKEKLIISIEKNNEPSKKTALAFGASLICYRQVPKNHVLYNSTYNNEVMIYIYDLKERGMKR